MDQFPFFIMKNNRFYNIFKETKYIMKEINEIEESCIWFKLPDDILTSIVWNFLKPEIKVWTNKKNYEKYHPVIKKMIPTNIYDSYVRDMVRNNNSYVLEQLFKENFLKWTKWKNYKYKNAIYNNYIDYLEWLGRDYNSIKCGLLINKYYEKYQVRRKNGIKTMSNNDIKWSN